MSVLAGLREVPGVFGAALFDGQGACLDHTLTPPYQPDHMAHALQEVRLALQVFEGQDSATITSFMLQGEGGSLLTRFYGELALLVLVTPQFNPSMLTVAFNVVAVRLRSGVPVAASAFPPSGSFAPASYGQPAAQAAPQTAPGPAAPPPGQAPGYPQSYPADFSPSYPTGVRTTIPRSGRYTPLAEAPVFPAPEGMAHEPPYQPPGQAPELQHPDEQADPNDPMAAPLPQKPEPEVQPPPQSPTGQLIGAAAVEAMVPLLAKQLGPVARLVVREGLAKVSATPATLDTSRYKEFLRYLATQINDPARAARFIEDVRNFTVESAKKTL